MQLMNNLSQLRCSGVLIFAGNYFTVHGYGLIINNLVMDQLIINRFGFNGVKAVFWNHNQSFSIQ